MAERDAAGSSARRRRERRLRSFWRHEKLAIQMALSEAMHHSASRGAWHVSNAALRGQKPDRAGDAAGTEFHAMSEVDELPAAGVRPPSLGGPPGPAVKVGRVQQPGAFELPSLDAPVLHMEDQLVDVLGYFSTLVPIENARRRRHPRHFHQLFSHLRSRKNSAKRRSGLGERLGHSDLLFRRSSGFSRPRAQAHRESAPAQSSRWSAPQCRDRWFLSSTPATSGRGDGSSSYNWESSGLLSAIVVGLRGASYAAQVLSVFCARRPEYFASAATLSKLWWAAADTLRRSAARVATTSAGVAVFASTRPPSLIAMQHHVNQWA